jgi:hypothetical protein
VRRSGAPNRRSRSAQTPCSANWPTFSVWSACLVPRVFGKCTDPRGRGVSISLVRTHDRLSFFSLFLCHYILLIWILWQLEPFESLCLPIWESGALPVDILVLGVFELSTSSEVLGIMSGCLRMHAEQGYRMRLKCLIREPTHPPDFSTVVRVALLQMQGFGASIRGAGLVNLQSNDCCGTLHVYPDYTSTISSSYARTFADGSVDGQSASNIKPEPIRSQELP